MDFSWSNTVLTLSCFIALLTTITISKNIFYDTRTAPQHCEGYPNYGSKITSSCMKSAEEIFCASLNDCTQKLPSNTKEETEPNFLPTMNKRYLEETQNALPQFRNNLADLQISQNEVGPKFSVTRMNDFKWKRGMGATVVKLFKPKASHVKRNRKMRGCFRNRKHQDILS